MRHVSIMCDDDTHRPEWMKKLPAYMGKPGRNFPQPPSEPEPDSGVQLGHRDGGRLVESLYGHGEVGALEYLEEAWRDVG